MPKYSVLPSRLVCVTYLLFGACSVEVAPLPDDIEKLSSDLAWAPNDAPALFDRSLVYSLNDLPLEGRAAVAPWAANYWPTHKDSVNQRWDGADSESATEKYGRAFGSENVPDAVSWYFGVDSQRRRTECTERGQCDSDRGERCSIREDSENGRCIPSWFGICHAWAPAAVLYEEPRREVTRNGVTLKINDIKALLTLAHDDGLQTRFVSGRCNEDDQNDMLELDLYDRPVLGQCIDTNPATYHVLLTNYLGLRGTSFIEDRTLDDEVWNQPVLGYRITAQDEISSREANALVGVYPEGSEHLQPTPEHKDFDHFGPFFVPAGGAFRATLKGNGDADLYVRVGEAPDTRGYDCRGYSASANERCDLTVADQDREAYVGVYNFRSASELNLLVSAGGEVPEKYQFNPAAQRFYEVALEVDYITESPAWRDGNLSEFVETYTRTDRYSYLLEADADGRLLGGEWLGRSKRNHVDFLWLPTHVSPHSIAGGALDFHTIMGVYYSSVANEEGDVVQEHEISLRRGQWRRFGPFPVREGGKLAVQLDGHAEGGGDADLYVRRAGHPSRQWYDCRSNGNDSAEDCELGGDAASYYVGVHGYAAHSAVKLRVAFESELANTRNPENPDPSDEEPL